MIYFVIKIKNITKYIIPKKSKICYNEKLSILTKKIFREFDCGYIGRNNIFSCIDIILGSNLPIKTNQNGSHKVICIAISDNSIVHFRGIMSLDPHHYNAPAK